MSPRIVDYDSIASSYDRRYLHNEYSGIEAFLLGFTNNCVGRILEVGCGTGHWLALLAKREPLVVGIDLSARMLEQANPALGRARLLRGRAEALPFQSRSFDRIFCINAFHHFSDKATFVYEASRLLRPEGGLLTVGLDPHTGTDRWWIYDYFAETREIDMRRYPAAREIRALMEQAGLRDCVTQEVQHLPAEVTAQTAEEMGLFERSSTSQLAILQEDEYQRGLDRLRLDIDAARERGQELMLKADLRLYATVGWAA